MESISSFLSRIASFGCDVTSTETDITVLSDGDYMPGSILARRGNVYLCGVGYPTEDGIFTSFELVYIFQDSGIDPEDNECVSAILGAIKAPISKEAYASDVEDWEEAGGWARFNAMEAPFEELGFDLDY